MEEDEQEWIKGKRVEGGTGSEVDRQSKEQ